MSFMILGFPIFSILVHFLSIKTFSNSAWTQNNKDFIVETMYNKQLQHQYHTEVVASDNNHLNYIFISSSHTNIQVFLLSSQLEKNKILNFFFQQLLFYATARIFHYSSWIALRWNWENIQENVRNTGGGERSPWIPWIPVKIHCSEKRQADQIRGKSIFVSIYLLQDISIRYCECWLNH